jgi:hypothetical protein
MNDYSDVIAEYWPTVMQAWDTHGDKHPVIECNLQSRQVLACPAKDYIKTLSQRTRRATLRQYRKVTGQGGMMLFINDYEHQILQSYIFSKDDLLQSIRVTHRPRES